MNPSAANNNNNNNNSSGAGGGGRFLSLATAKSLDYVSMPSHKSKDPNSILDVKDLRRYFYEQNEKTHERLYGFTAVCVAVYRELSELARHFVIRMVFVDQPVPRAVIASWISTTHAVEVTACESLLKKLHIWRLTAIPGGLEAWELCPKFKRNIKQCILGGGQHVSLTPIPLERSKPRDVSMLDNYGMARWRCVLHYMVGISNGNVSAEDNVSPDAVRTLIRAGLMHNSRNSDGCSITRLGFQFLLLDTNTQVWHFMLAYLDQCHTMGLDSAECLGFLFQLSDARLGRDYSSEGFDDNKLKFLQHLREFGLVFQRKRKDKRFYPTRLAVCATLNGEIARRIAQRSIADKNDGQVVSMADDNSAGRELIAQLTGFIIVETNYRVFAYTSSALHLAVLALFTEINRRFPQFVVCTLTRDACKQAFRVGITAHQIIAYLEQHAHPCMLRQIENSESKSLLPLTIMDQLKIWQQERERITMEEGFVYNGFLTVIDFSILRDYADSINGILWQNERMRVLIINKEAHDDVKKYWKKYSK